MGGALRGVEKKITALFDEPDLIDQLPIDDPERAQLVAMHHRLATIAELARRTRLINTAFGCSLSPDVIAREWPEEDTALIAAWMEYSA